MDGRIEDLSAKKRHSEAGRVLVEYCSDVKQAVIAFVEGSAFSEAKRVVGHHLDDFLFWR
jgi:elongator complex protein 1